MKMKLIDYSEIKKLFDVEFKETKKLIDDGETHLDNLAEGFLEADRVIDRLPDVDAVEVVRCRNCHYRRESDKTNRSFCAYHGEDVEIQLDDFCSYGSRE